MKKTLSLLLLTLSAFTLLSCTQKEETKEPELTGDYTFESYKTMIPESCKSFFDGCNNCFRAEDGNVGCTKMFCQKYEMPRCLDEESSQEESKSKYTEESWKTIIPETCKSFFDGCNNCSRTENSTEAACTLMYCDTYKKPKCLDK
ncbi:MAG: hypothetical protein RBS56_00600 [Candidatus Gracilibacteria bacterium]|jgi:hypothetical protein|nr:hypothetical protein [Candidatus Gracilibacteria bacterium]